LIPNAVGFIVWFSTCDEFVRFQENVQMLSNVGLMVYTSLIAT
jgi:hypothetical protein